MSDRDRFVSVAVAARKCQCSPATIRRWIDEGLIRAWRPAKRKAFRIRSSHLDAILAADLDPNA